MRWYLTNRFDARAARLADRHYTRQTIGSDQFMPPGKAIVLITEEGDAVWGSSWQIAATGILMATHAWPRAWNCSIFRNESEHLSSDLIREAVAATLAIWTDAPEQGFVTFVDASKVRRKRDPGRCYIRAGWERVGMTMTGKIALQLPRDRFPEPDPPFDGGNRLFALPERSYGPQRRSIGGEIL